MKLMKSIYRMKQASRAWNCIFDKAVKAWSFEQLPSEWCIYRLQTPTSTIIFAVHVDDIISASTPLAENEQFKASLKEKWDISDLGPVKLALGITVAHDLDAGTISISQTALINCVTADAVSPRL
jgi:Reverse transcriptase (RNA-dependent DNA polymerase)